MLDVTEPNALRIAAGMGATRNEQLAEYYLRAAGVAAIWIDPDGHVGAHDVARLQLDPGRIAYCCVRGAHFVLAYRLQLWKQDQHTACPMPLAIAAMLEQLAEEGGVGLTPHQLAIERALAAVATVNKAMDEMKGRRAARVQPDLQGGAQGRRLAPVPRLSARSQSRDARSAGARGQPMLIPFLLGVASRHHSLADARADPGGDRFRRGRGGDREGGAMIGLVSGLTVLAAVLLLFGAAIWRSAGEWLAVAYAGCRRRAAGVYRAADAVESEMTRRRL
jgi:hypothetical protein